MRFRETKKDLEMAMDDIEMYFHNTMQDIFDTYFVFFVLECS